MHADTILDQLIKTGKEIAATGWERVETLAEEKLNLPQAGPDRDAALTNAGKGAAAAAALMLLLGTKSGRALSKAAVKVGSLAALGGLAYKTYRDWQAEQNLTEDGPAGMPIGELAGYDATERSAHLLRAMVATASLDNQITAAERQRILERFSGAQIGGDAQILFQEAMANPLEVDAIAKPATTPTFAAEIYLACASMLDSDNAADRSYLAQLGRALELDADLTRRLEASIWS